MVNIVSRDLLEKLRPFLERREFIAITGPRQCGKTTFLEILKDYLIETLKVSPPSISTVTFEDRRLLGEFEKDPVAFVRSYAPSSQEERLYLMMDEFQYTEEGGQKLKLLYDTLRNVKIILTGSSSLELKAKVGPWMVGRIFTFHLYPFDFGEFLRAKDERLEKIYRDRSPQVMAWLWRGKRFAMKEGEDTFSGELSKAYEEFCIWGGYPAVVLAGSAVERKKILAEIYNHYILKDIKTLLELATERNLFLLSQYLATQIGQIVVYQNLSQTSGLDFRNLKKHLAILEETFIAREVRPFFRNRQKELSKNPKIYFMDVGFRNNLIENMNGLEKRPDAGALIENAVFIRLSALLENFHKINFWRTKAGAEVDFALDVGEGPLPLEVKYSPGRPGQIPRGLASFIDSFKPRRSVVLTKNYWGIARRNRTQIRFIPVYYL